MRKQESDKKKAAILANTLKVTSATLSDVCGDDVWSTNSGAHCTGTCSSTAYCTGGAVLGDRSPAVNCCTNKWGKQMVLRVCSQTTSGAASCAT